MGRFKGNLNGKYQYTNFITDKIEYTNHPNSDSCGFYVINTICNFAMCVVKFSFIIYSSENYFSDISKKLRVASVRVYFEMVEESFKSFQNLESQKPCQLLSSYFSIFSLTRRELKLENSRRIRNSSESSTCENPEISGFQSNVKTNNDISSN